MYRFERVNFTQGNDIANFTSNPHKHVHVQYKYGSVKDTLHFHDKVGIEAQNVVVYRNPFVIC